MSSGKDLVARPFLSFVFFLWGEEGGGGGREDFKCGLWDGGGRAARDLRDVGFGHPGGPGILFFWW